MHNNSRSCLSFLLLFILVVLSYSNTFDSSWHLDDYQSILNNRFLHIKEISIKSLSDVISHKDYGNFTRPLSKLTFAINWYLGKDNAKGYHVVNTGIHVFSAFFLFLTILMLFKTPNLKNRFSEENGYFISMLSAALWAVNPVQTQSVTYIVQRMSSMAAMFYIIGIFLYIKGRLSDSAYKKFILYFCIFLTYILALGTKENTITLPLSLVLVEIIFFQDLGRAEIRRKNFYIAAGLAVIITLAGFFLFIGTDTFNIFQGYENRNFTPGERLLTEARVLVYYLSLIFYPAPTRLSIEHDIDVSASFFYPWTTMPSIIIIVILIGLGIWQARKRPLLSFAILFFFLNHVIESSIIGLELIFEHRNYLPSFFLFVPVSTGLKWLIDRYHDRKGMFYLIFAFVILLITGYGISTHIRNIKWASEISLTMDAVRKAPESARSLNNLAKAYYEGTGQYDKAIELYHKALYLKTHNRYYKAFILNNIAGVYYHLGEHRRAGEFWEKAIRIYPAYDFAKYGLAMVSVKADNWDRGLHYLDDIIPENRENSDVLNLKGIMLFYQGRYEDALSCFRKGMIINSDEIKSSINIGAAFCLMGDYGKAGFFLRDVRKRKPDDVMTLLWLIETGLRANDDKSVDLYSERLGSGIKTNELVLLAEKLSAKKYSEDGILTPVYQEFIAGKIYEIVKAKAYLINVRQKTILIPQKK
jgi:tetratricopeptide (TPR) repeat protein